MASPAVPGSRHGGLRQEDVANLAGISLRRYAALERGEFTPPAAMVDRVAAALQMSGAERSALHVLATGQDPPRSPTCPTEEKPQLPGRAVRDLISRLGPYPAAVTDEKWTVLFHNRAMDDWAGGWYGAADPSDRNLVMHLFSSSAGDFRPDLHMLRRAGIAMLRYRYTRDLASPGFSRLIAKLVESSGEAAELWSRHEVVFPAHEYPIRVRRPDTGIVDAHVLHAPVTPRLWIYTMMLPSKLRSAP